MDKMLHINAVKMYVDAVLFDSIFNKKKNNKKTAALY